MCSQYNIKDLNKLQVLEIIKARFGKFTDDVAQFVNQTINLVAKRKEYLKLLNLD